MYNVKKKKSAFKRIITLMMTVLTLGLVMSLVPLSANAAEAPAVTAAVAEELPSVISDGAFITMDASAVNAAVITAPKIYTMEDTAVAAAGDDAAYQNIVNFFIKWFRRIGVLVAFVGGIMFALAIKNNDAEQKQNGLMTLVAGFAVAALCTGVSMFDLFS
ncbi:MAG: hypothetical protein IJJ69_06800 [Oscillospiraceae bacterium]|nr:hypothetical protein [Oscillospiraceae bacterium]